MIKYKAAGLQRIKSLGRNVIVSSNKSQALNGGFMKNNDGIFYFVVVVVKTYDYKTKGVILEFIWRTEHLLLE